MNSNEQMIEVDSGHLHSVSHHNAMDQSMTIQFKNGYQYKVHGISAKAYQDFMNAPSQGNHYHNFIKDNYAVERIK
jgi:hypothetical protein